jgi:hypothetical protein
VSEFKKIIEEKTQVPVDRQRLIYKAKLLTDDMSISHYSMSVKLTIQSRRMGKLFISSKSLSMRRPRLLSLQILSHSQALSRGIQALRLTLLITS